MDRADSRARTGLGRSLVELLPVEGDGAGSLTRLFEASRADLASEVCAAGVAFLSSVLPDDLCGHASTAPGRGARTSIVGPAVGAEGPWALSDALRQACTSGRLVSVRHGRSECLAAPAGDRLAIGVRRDGAQLDPREVWLVETVARACQLALPDRPRLLALS
jgi:hypothetical protein